MLYDAFSHKFTSVFFRPVLIEIPHFASLRGKEREIQIMRSDNGETWYEHPLIATDDAVAQAMAGTFEGGKPVDSMLSEPFACVLLFVYSFTLSCFSF